MSNLQASGVVEAVARNGKAFMLDNDPDIWFSAPRGESYSADLKGAEVSFEYKENPKGDTVFYNVQGKLDVVGGAPARSRGSSNGASRGRAVPEKARGNGTDGVDGDAFRKRSMKYFPMPKDDVDRPIVRANALTQANALYRTVVGEDGLAILDDAEAMKEAAEDIVALARIFEAYSTGEV